MAIWDVSVQCLLELAKLQINIGNAKKKSCLLVFGYNVVPKML